MTVEEGVVHDLRSVGIAGKQERDGAVAFAIERREEINQYCQNHTAERESSRGMTKFAEDLFKGVHDTREVERNKSAGDTEQQSGGHSAHNERVGEFKGEHR